MEEITLTSAVFKGTVTAHGGVEVTERGVCWSTSPNPTTADNSKAGGNGLGDFSVR